MNQRTFPETLEQRGIFLVPASLPRTGFSMMPNACGLEFHVAHVAPDRFRSMYRHS